jgi:hypothetical protein
MTLDLLHGLANRYFTIHVGVLLNDDTATTPTDHSSGRASPHRIINPRKPPRSRFSLTPFLTRLRSGRVGWPAFQWNLPSIPPRHCGHQERERVPESGSSSSLTFVVA